MAKKKLWKEIPPEKMFNLTLVGHRLLVKPLGAKQRSGVIETLESTDQSDQLAQVYGQVLQVGHLAFKDLSGTTIHYRATVSNDVVDVDEKIGKPWCVAGDVVLYHPFSYQRIRDPITMDYRDDMCVINDQDVIAVVRDLDRYKAEYERLEEEEKQRVEAAKPKW